MSKMHVVADMEINRFLRAFDTREEAIEYVGRLLKTNGDEYVHELSVGRQTADGTFVDILKGESLLAIVRADSQERERAAARHGEPVSSYGYSGSDSGEAAAMAAKPWGK